MYETKSYVPFNQSWALHVRQPLSREETVALRDSPATDADRAAVEAYWQSERGVGTAAKKLDEYARPLLVPQLIVRDGKRSYLFEPEELDEFSWSLDQCPVPVAEGEFSIDLNVGDRVSVAAQFKGGDAQALKSLVLRTRPNGAAFTWHFDIELKDGQPVNVLLPNNLSDPDRVATLADHAWFII